MAALWRARCGIRSTSFVVLVMVFLIKTTTGTYQCPSACSCLGPLVDCSNRELTEIPQDLPSWVVILDLKSNSITGVEGLASQGLTKLEKLDLSRNQLETINGTTISQLPSLKELKLNYNQLKDIPVLLQMTNLTSLSLEHNEIEYISAEALDRMPKLETLELGNNLIKELTVDMFPLHANLHQLYLNNNRIKKIDKGALRNIPNLQWLKLNKNKIKHLPKEVFANLTKLQDLELSRNRLQTIEGLTFKGLTALVTLRLDRNAISDLMDGAFYGPGNIHNLILDHNNITVIAKGWLYGLSRLEVLELSHNYISQIEEEVWTYCELLSRLDLSHNRLSLVTDWTFSSLGSLQHLLLSNNQMSYIAQGAFKDLGSLHVLELDNNEISWPIEDMNGAFNGLNSLKRLTLRNNQITSIAKHAFDGLKHLHQLHLEDNALRSILMNAFGEMDSLQEIHINSSSLVCDCQLAWFPGWLRLAGFVQLITAKCIYPETVKGKNIMEVDEKEFNCNDSPKPVIMIQPESQAALKGSNSSLECIAISSDSSDLVVQWRKNNTLLQSARVENYKTVSADGMMEVRSVLVNSNIQDGDGGVFQCVVSNNLGTAYSAKAEITVNVLPYFIKTPEDETARAGTTARLECKATGHPPPRIAWKKDGGDNFPAARERRLLMMPTDDVFFITKVNMEDEGVYSCTAENNVGTVIANATLTVLKKPVFEDEMEDKVVEIGSTAVMECMAIGSPKPDIDWFKDSKPLQVTKRHFFTAEKRLLVIYRTEKADEGVYTCRVSNALAKEEGHSRLTVTTLDLAQINMQSSTGDNQSKGSIFGEDSMMTGIIIIAVVCCVVGTSLIWVIIIYKTRKRTEEYSSTPTDETTLPGEMPSTPYHSSDRDSNSPGLITSSHMSSSFGKYPMEVNNGGFNYSPAKGVRLAAIFPSDMEDDHMRQSIPLTSDEQQPAESSDTSIQMLRRTRHSADSLHSTASPHHSSEHSLQSNRSAVLHTFQPHLSHLLTQQCQHSPAMSCECCDPRTTVALVHSANPREQQDSSLRLDTIVSEDETGGRYSSDDRDNTLGRHTDGHHGSQPPGRDGDYSENEDIYPSPHQYLQQDHCLDSGGTLSYPHSSYTLPQPYGGDCSPDGTGNLRFTSHGVAPLSHTYPYHTRSGMSSRSVSHTRPCHLPADSCTDSESCLEDDDALASLPQVAIIPNWYQSSGMGSATRDNAIHVNDSRDL